MSALAPWRAHLALIAVMLATTLLAALRHRSDAELEEVAASGASALERIAALHVLACRPSADEQRCGLPLARRLVLEQDPRLVEFAGTIGPCRFGDVGFLEQRLLAPPLGDVAAWLRQFVFYRRKVGGRQVGGRRRLTLQEVSWMLDALAGRELPNMEVLRYVESREAGLPAKFERDRRSDD
jgi:hypothetical protein